MKPLINYSENDVNLELAIRAHHGTSFVPEKRGRMYVEWYTEHMAKVDAEFQQYTTDENRPEIITELDEYRRRWLLLMNDLLYAKTNCVSAFIAGPSKFPVSRAQKASNRADAKREKWTNFEAQRLRLLRRRYDPRRLARAPIRLDDGNAIERLEAKIAKLKANQELMKAANKVIRSKKLSDNEKVDELTNALGFNETSACELIKPDWAGRPGFPAYALSNNNAKIRRYEGRLIEAQREASREQPDAYPAVDGVKAIENTDETRIQLVFNGKPPVDTRTLLKSNGFRWAPSQGAWQRLLNDNGRRAAKQVLHQLQGAGRLL